MSDDPVFMPEAYLPPKPTIVVFTLPEGLDVNTAPIGQVFDQISSPNIGASPGSMYAQWHKTRFRIETGMHREQETRTYVQKQQRLLTDEEIAEYTARANAGEGVWI